MPDTYDFTYNGKPFKKDLIKVVKGSPWIVSISYEGEGYVIVLSQACPLFRAFLDKSRAPGEW